MIRRLNLGTWLVRLLAWDGILPVVVLVGPSLVKTLFPNRRGIMEVTAVALPLIAFLIRFFAGWMQIQTNSCSRPIRFLQAIAFFIAILAL